MTLVAAIAGVGVVIGGVSLWLDGYSTVRTLLSQHEANEGLTRAQANAAGGSLFPADEGFMAWADARQCHQSIF